MENHEIENDERLTAAKIAGWIIAAVLAWAGVFFCFGLAIRAFHWMMAA